MDTTTLEHTTTEEIVRFIDEWLDENSWKIDATMIDFALDIRRLVAGGER